MPRANQKGSGFEREICKRLSFWWTEGARDDVFWRACQSGGRATQRAKQGVATAGSYGDIMAIDPIGKPLLDFFTIELKRGALEHPSQLIERKPSEAVRRFEAAVWQAIESHEQARSKYWLLIVKRDARDVMIYIPSKSVRHFQWSFCPSSRYWMRLNKKDGTASKLAFYSTRLDTFLRHIDPADVRNALQGPVKSS